MFVEKFEKLENKRNLSLEVFSLAEVCEQYGVRPLQSAGWAWLSSLFWLDRNKVDIINDLCKKMRGNIYNGTIVYISEHQHFGVVNFCTKNTIYHLSGAKIK